MVNLPTIQRIETKLATVDHLINNGNGASQPKRKRMANCGFMRSDRWSRKHGFSYNTVNKYRGVLYGDEAFLPPTPTTGGRIRIANEVAEKLLDHGVRPRHKAPAQVGNQDGQRHSGGGHQADHRRGRLGQGDG